MQRLKTDEDRRRELLDRHFSTLHYGALDAKSFLLAREAQRKYFQRRAGDVRQLPVGKKAN